ncbi:hypothetical protein FIBSPDRAFT_967444 [Athelia psychrophila]|uniref:Uncharacterized protein n=1 Tax=Athelia psychrophila TaxID=1759441 RepID=A0A167VPW9_9AGAM|nr:hypothetical protein FIBSPDRAFT_967444 [Fibularhizoctonia sp. CBS 109695]
MAKNVAEIGLGPMLIGTMLDILLYGIMIAQVHTYFTTFPKDRKLFKCFVLFLLVANALNVLFDAVYVYQTLVVHYGDTPYLMTANWVFATDPAMTGIISSSVQFFFAWRVKVISGNALKGVSGINKTMKTCQNVYYTRTVVNEFNHTFTHTSRVDRAHCSDHYK